MLPRVDVGLEEVKRTESKLCEPQRNKPVYMGVESNGPRRHQGVRTKTKSSIINP